MRLTVETGPLAGTVVSLDREHPSILGSGAECALRIREAGVLDRHAVVKALRGEGFGLKALGPGVRVNGAQIEATPLQDGDVIELGTTRIAFGETQRQGLPAISGYRIKEELGRGGMGVVYRAEQVSLSRAVALKVLSHDLTEDAKFVSNFVAEAQAAAKLHHPNVVSVFDVEHDGDTYFYSMELMDNGSCEDWLRQNGAMPADRALRVIADAAEGLAYAESLGIVHRDLKPDNLMLDRHGVVKIADLGLAGADAANDDRAFGTPHFMAPEQVLRKPIDHRTDLYALGCTFYRLVTGRTPFRGHTVKDILRAQVREEAEPAHKINPKVPAELATIIQRLMAKEPAGRYQTANELLEDLAVLLQPPAKKSRWIALAAAAVLLAGGATWWALNKKGETVTIREVYDDPEKQRFADENRQLRDQARQDKATIALLSARVSGLLGEQLAQTLDQVAAEHTDTRAAIEASERAQAIRTQLRERALRARELQQQVEAHLAKVAEQISPQLAAHDFALAMQTLRAEPDPAIAGEATLQTGLDELRQRVLGAARERIGALCAAVDDARGAADAARLVAALVALDANLAAGQRWPAGLEADLESAGRTAKTARETLAALQEEFRVQLWLDYRALFVREDGIASCIARFDFAGAARTAADFAAGCEGQEAGQRAATIAQAMRGAEQFAAALATALAADGLRCEGADGEPVTVRHWDREAGTVTLLEPDRRTTKERVTPVAELTPANWAELSAQVAEPATGQRGCFLAFFLLARHAEAARAYLGGIAPADEDSGTGEHGYPLASDWFDAVARALPDDETAPWVPALRDEIAAGQRLAAGLRALSERRNLAAAGHLEKLLADHAHSYLVMVLP